MPNPVVHWEIMGKDAGKTQSFFRDLFGWKVTADNRWNYGMVDTETSQGINGGVGTDPGGPAVRIYVQVDDLRACLSKAESMGAKVVMPITDIPGAVTMALFADPDGNVVGLAKG
jgi:predicted enzyme related to lactoylglutathione lyase